jgi:hypothetical protein
MPELDPADRAAVVDRAWPGETLSYQRSRGLCSILNGPCLGSHTYAALIAVADPTISTLINQALVVWNGSKLAFMGTIQVPFGSEAKDEKSSHDVVLHEDARVSVESKRPSNP